MCLINFFGYPFIHLPCSFEAAAFSINANPNPLNRPFQECWGQTKNCMKDIYCHLQNNLKRCQRALLNYGIASQGWFPPHR